MAFRPASYEFFAALPFPHEKTVKTSIASDRHYTQLSNNRCRMRSRSQKTFSTPPISQTRTLASASRPASWSDPREHPNSQPHSFSPRRSHILSRNPKVESQRTLANSHRRSKICADVFAALPTRRNPPFAQHQTGDAKRSKTPTINAEGNGSRLECHGS